MNEIMNEIETAFNSTVRVASVMFFAGWIGLLIYWQITGLTPPLFTIACIGSASAIAAGSFAFMQLASLFYRWLRGRWVRENV